MDFEKKKFLPSLHSEEPVDLSCMAVGNNVNKIMLKTTRISIVRDI